MVQNSIIKRHSTRWGIGVIGGVDEWQIDALVSALSRAARIMLFGLVRERL